MLIHCPEPCVVCAPPPPGAENLGIFPNPNDPNNPFSNLTSEAPDRPMFVGHHYDGGGSNNDGPAIGDPWTSTGCIGVCISTVSQSEADLCAAVQQAICDSFINPTYPFCEMYPNSVQCNPPNVPPSQSCATNPSIPQCQPGPAPLFYNDAYTCSQDCGDGNVSTMTVAAGTFAAKNKVTANLMAQTYACDTVRTMRLCLGNMSPTLNCLGEPYSAVISGTSNLPSTLSFELDSALPAGLNFVRISENALQISGVPIIPGFYTFGLTLRSDLGPSIKKTYSLSVKGISTQSPLPDATSGTLYSKFILFIGPLVGTPVFSLTSGELPPGLTLNAVTGEISGTPTDTQAASYGFTVTATDNEVACSKTFTLTVLSALNWSQLLWEVAGINTLFAGTASFTPSSINSDNFSTATSAPDGGNLDFGQTTNQATLTFNGPATNCNLHLILAKGLSTASVSGSIAIQLDVNLVLLVTAGGSPDGTMPSGTYDIPFVIPDTGGVPLVITVFVTCQSISGGFPDDTPSISMIGTFTNV